MLPSLESLQQKFNHWQQLSWPHKGLRAGIVLLPIVIVWPIIVGAGYAIVVQARLKSAPTRTSLISVMLVSCLVAQGAWWQLLYAGATLSTTASDSPMAEQVGSGAELPKNGQVAGARNQSENSALIATVTKVVSGSFLEIEIQDHAYQVQLIGLKAPMPGAHSHPPECYGDESQRYLQGLIGSSGRVQLATDGQLPDQDEFGILQRYVMGQDGSLLNRQMIDAGMVEESGGAGYDQKVAFMGAQEAAKAAERGLWGACRQDVPTPTPTTSPQATPTSTPVGAVSTEPNVVRPIAPTSIPTPQPTQKPAKIGNTDELPEVQLQQSSGSGQPA